jgi:hypothetical protein
MYRLRLPKIVLLGSHKYASIRSQAGTFQTTIKHFFRKQQTTTIAVCNDIEPPRLVLLGTRVPGVSMHSLWLSKVGLTEVA